MPRTPDPRKREELLAAVVGYLEEHGVNDLSLAPMAEALGTSKRMLLYYFGDRQSLVEQAQNAARPKVGNIFADIEGPEDLERAAWDLWVAITRGAQRRSITMLLQVLSLATTDPQTYGGFAETGIDVMLTPITAAFRAGGFTPRDAAVRATLVVSALRGLCQDLLITGDRARVDAAARRVIETAVRTG